MTKSLRYATVLALTTAFISGTANFVNKFAVTAVKDAIVFTTLKNAIVAVFLIGLILGFRKLREIKTLTGKQWLMLLVVGLVGGAIPFGLFFTGLKMTGAINASLIHKTLFIWVALLAVPLLKERMARWQWVGVGLIFAANLVVGGFQGFKYNIGELMILAATLLWAVENVVAKVAMRDVSSLVLASARMVLGTLFLAVYAVASRDISPAYALSGSQWGWVLATGVLLSGYVLTWYTALKHAPATYVATLLVPATLVTNVLSSVFITHAFTGRDLVGAVLYVAGAILVVWFARSIVSVNPERSPWLTDVS